MTELTYENVALREDLQRARLTIERLEGEIENLYRAAQAATVRGGGLDDFLARRAAGTL